MVGCLPEQGIALAVHRRNVIDYGRRGESPLTQANYTQRVSAQELRTIDAPAVVIATLRRRSPLVVFLPVLIATPGGHTVTAPRKGATA